MKEIPASTPPANVPGPADAIDELPVAYVEMDAHGAIIRANRITRAMHSSHVGALIGKMAWELMPIEDQDLSCAAFVSAMETGIDPGKVRRSIYSSQETFRVFDLYRNLIRNAEGKPTGMRVVSVDVTEAVTTQQDAEKACQWLQCIFASIPDAIIVTDALGVLRNANPAAEALFGWKADELIGREFEEVFSPRSVDGLAKIKLVTVLSQNVHGVVIVNDRERRPMRVEIRSSPMLEKKHGFTSGVVNVMCRVEEGDLQ
jgi:PAS domain S-box-containing protein